MARTKHQTSDFIVGDNPERRGDDDEVRVSFHRRNQHLTMVWKMSYDDLVELQTTIGTYLADG